MLHHRYALAAIVVSLARPLYAEETVKYPPGAGNEGGIVTAEVSCGELVDKITILEIKSSKFTGEKKKNVDTELETLRKTHQTFLPQTEELEQVTNELRAVNRKLWKIEDDIRAKERDKEFDEEFIRLARSVYFTNDERGKCKQAINKICGSRLVEEKGYTEYKTEPAHPPSSGQLTAAQHVELGTAALKARNREKTFHHLNAALAIDPHNTKAIATLGTLHYVIGDYEQSQCYHRQLLAMSPDSPVLNDRLASAVKMLGNFDALIPLEQRVHRARPGKDTTMRMFMAYARAMRWQEAEEVIRGSIFGMENYWRGESDINGKRILVPMLYKVGSSGFGDVFQFVRYTKRLHEAGAHVIAQISNTKLRPLLSLCPFIDQIVTEDEETPAHDARYPLCATAMILAFKDEVDKPSRDVPYMYADANLVRHWRNKLAGDTNFRIGIFWQRGQVHDYFSGAPMPCSRSMRLDALAPLATIPGVSFYSLQKGYSDETKHLPAGFVVNEFNPDEFDASNGSFMDTAAVMKNMDLVITIDSSIAHLAGALGVPVWTMLPTSSCYRWFTNRSDSPWYPTMRLFRQTKPNVWDDVIEQVKGALAGITRR